MKIKILFLLSSLLIGGCATIQGSSFPDQPIANYTASKGASPDEVSKALDKDVSEALEFCRTVLNYYEAKANRSSNVLTTVAIVGSIAGAVVVPALTASSSMSATAIAAVGGISGVANAAQSSIVGQGLGPDSYLSTRAKITGEIQGIIEDYYQETDPQRRSGLVIKLYSSCIANDITAAPTT